MLTTQKNHVDVLIAKNVSRGTYTAGTTVINESSDLTEGEVVIVDESNIIQDTTTVLTANKIRLVQGRASGQPLKMSGFINLDDLVSYKGDKFVATREQINYVGYNGTDGSIRVFDDNFYTVRYFRRSNDVNDRSGFCTKYFIYESDSDATEEEIALGLVKNAVSQFKHEPESGRNKMDGFVRVNIINSAALVAANDFVNDVAVVRGSDRITHTTNANYATSTALAVGDYIRFDASITGTVATTDPVYRVEELVSATETRLDRPITAVASATYTAAAAANCEVIPAATATAADFGLKVESQPFQFDVVNWRLYHKAHFKLSLENFGATENRNPTSARAGTGVAEQAALDEYMSWGNEGQFQLGVPPTSRFQDVNLSGAYSILSIGYQTPIRHLVGGGDQFGEVRVYIENTTAAGGTLSAQASGQAQDIMDVLDTWASQKVGISNQVSNLT